MTFEEMKEELYKREEEAMNDRDTADDDEYLDGVFDGLHEASKLMSITDPVRHGRWVEFVNEDGYLDLKCSLCGEAQHVTFVRFNYCPNCGARMTEESE